MLLYSKNFGLIYYVNFSVIDTLVHDADETNTHIRARGPLTRYVKLRFVYAPGMSVTFSPPPT